MPYVGGFDIIFGDHTNVEFAGVINNALVVENRSGGRTYARVDLTVDPRNGRVIDRSVEFVNPVSDAVIPDPAIVAFLDPLRAELNVLLSAVIGESTLVIPRADECGQSRGRTGESLVGDVTTDAMRTTYGTDFAITNSGGLRVDLTCPIVDNPTDFCPPNTPPNFQITDGQLLTVLPFGNVVATLTIDGAELKDYLENGVSAMPDASGRFAQVSGLCFTYDIDAAAGSRVTGAVRQAADGTCTGPVVDLTSASTYTLAIIDFMAAGGDGYPEVSDRIATRNFLDQDVADYIEANTPISPMIGGRIGCIGSTCPVPGGQPRVRAGARILAEAEEGAVARHPAVQRPGGVRPVRCGAPAPDAPGCAACDSLSEEARRRAGCGESRESRGQATTF